MGTVQKPRKSPKKSRKDKDREREPQIVTRTFADNSYTGTIAHDSLGTRCFESSSAKYTWKTGVTYEGPFVKSQIDGRGRFLWPDGSTYQGEISNGKRHGVGLYVGPDGVTRYEGQWREGKRHGMGKLAYDAAGESYYHGEWQDGCKHGEGRQVWPSRNMYEGQWKHGRMAGTGTMTWRDGGSYEQYCGNWEDDHPQGAGTHAWHAPQPNPDHGARDMPSQQMNNCYKGQWRRGVRHGHGTFNYANGARYFGAWDDNVKQGQGRYTYEDGRVYNGPFTSDQIGEPSAGMTPAPNRPALNIGAEDNPVRRCIDISDLEPFCLPLDVGAHDLTIGSGYDETEEVLREAYNMLLRYLGELKQFYSQYRMLIRRPSEDPFVLSMHQFWLLFRDLGFITPQCPLGRLNRWVLTGPRHHQEVAHGDVDDLRPLTPREVLCAGGSPQLPGTSPVLNSSVLAGDSIQHEDTEASSLASSSVLSPRSRRPSVQADQESLAPELLAPEHGEAGYIQDDRKATLDSLQIDGLAPPVPLYTKFWRKEGSDDLVDIHAPSYIVMFRHFLEGIVRVSLARYPNEKGLEHQIRRLFKENIGPKVGSVPTDVSVFAFVVDPDFQKVFEAFQPELWGLFKHNATGEGHYGAPRWGKVADGTPPHEDANVAGETVPDEGDAPLADGAAPDEGGAKVADGTAPNEDDAKEADGTTPDEGDAGHEDATASQARDAASNADAGGSGPGAPPGARRSLRRSFGGPHRRVHVRARLDVTIRVKDVFHMFCNGGLLRPLADDEDLGSEDPYGPVILADAGATRPPTEEGAEAAKEADGSRDAGRGAAEGEGGPAPGDAPQVLEPPLDASDAGRPHGAAPPGEPRGRDSEGVLSPSVPEAPRRPLTMFTNPSRDSPEDPSHLDAKTPPPDDALPTADSPAEKMEESSFKWTGGIDGVPKASPVEAETADVLRCNFQVTFQDLLRILTDVMLPECRSKLRWALERGAADQDEHMALLDYLETELTYVEFQRLLLRVAEQQSQQTVFPGRMQPHRRLEGFLTHVFLPAMSGKPYEPPPSTDKGEEAEEAVEDPLAEAVKLAKERAAEVDEAKAAVAEKLATLQKAPKVDKGAVGRATKEMAAAEAAATAAAAEVDAAIAAKVAADEKAKAKAANQMECFWRGFNDELLEADSVAVPRLWPDDYEREAADW